MSRRTPNLRRTSAAENIRAIARMDALLSGATPGDCDPVAVIMRRWARLKDRHPTPLTCNIDGEENDDHEYGVTRVKYVFDTPDNALNAARELRQAGLFLKAERRNVYLCDRQWAGRPPHYHLTTHPRV